MTLNIRAALDNLVTLQGGLEITSPSKHKIARAWKYPPPPDTVLPETPCWTNEVTFVGEDRGIGGFRIQKFTVQMQLFIKEQQVEQAADIAAAFLEKMIQALDGDVTLGQTVGLHKLRGGSPTIATLARSNAAYIGLDLYLDLELYDAVNYS